MCWLPEQNAAAVLYMIEAMKGGAAAAAAAAAAGDCCMLPWTL
jgi:hypothetical protein